MPQSDFSARRDWAAASGGAAITDFNGTDYTPGGCGPGSAIDLSQVTGWKTATGADEVTPTNVFVPEAPHGEAAAGDRPSTEFAVDPTANCGDGASASTGGYRIETSADGTTWTTASQGTLHRRRPSAS